MKTGKLKKASDIYSFGVVLFEILCGTLAYDRIYTTDTEKGLPSIARRLFKEGNLKAIVDPSIKETDGSIFSQNRIADQQSLDTFLDIAYQCLAETQDERPKMEDIIRELEKALNFQKNNKDNLQILLEDINLATQNFNDSNCIGEGEVWKLYKGEAPQALSNAKGCTAIVAKRFNKSGDHGQGHQLFFRELEFVFKHKHENVIDLLGYCTEMEERIIVYEHSLKGSLDNYLKDASLTWIERLKICIDVASGLEFLHKGGGPEERVMMRGDIKSGSILIDGDRKAKVSNLELIPLENFHLEKSTTVTYRQNTEADLYSLGVVLFEVLAGRSASDQDPSQLLGLLAIRWCREREFDEMVFEGIQDQIDRLSFDIFTSTAFLCFKTNSYDHPQASVVLMQLKKALMKALEYQNCLEVSPQLSLEHIKQRTQNFSDDKCVGKGKYWKLYEAVFPNANAADGYTTALVKRWDNNSREAHYEFSAERRVLSQYKNDDNIVDIAGYCNEKDEKIIVYEHGYNRRLDKHLDDVSFSWMKRLNICISVAWAVHSLYRDGIELKHVESGSILVDSEWKGKVSNLKVSLKELTTCRKKDVEMAYYQITNNELLVVLLEILCGSKLDPGEGCPETFKSLARILDELVFEGIKEKIAPESLNLSIEIVSKCLESPLRLREMVFGLMDARREQEYVEESPQISLEDMKSATENFNDKKCIDERRHWKLYEGEFPDNGYTSIARVKRFDSNSSKGRTQFFGELGTHFRYKEHENIVAVKGYCSETDEKVIVFEQGYTRSLDKHLDDTSLSWTKRLNISINVASVLDFIHNNNDDIKGPRSMTHGDITCASILIDSNWNAKVSLGYSDPQHQGAGMYKDVYSFGVVLFEMLCGRPEWSEECEDHSDSLGPLAKRHYEKNKNLIELVFEGIKEQIAQESLIAYQEIALKCIADTEDRQPVGREIVKQLQNALELQGDYHIWNSKLPKDYKKIFEMTSKTPVEKYTTKVKKDIYDMLTKGILLQQGKLWFKLGDNGERCEMISAMKFSYKNRPLRIWQSIPESRFQKVAQIFDISNLKIQIKIKTQLLSPGVDYGVYLVFKFYGSRIPAAKRVYVNLSYKMGKDNLHAYFATWRDDEWMMIELCRFSNNKEDVNFEALLKSFSRCYCGSRVIYVEGIEFRPINNECKEIDNLYGNDHKEAEKMLTNANGKKHLKLSPTEVLYDVSNVKPFHLNYASSVSRSQEVEFLPQQVFGIKYTIKSQTLSPDTDYMCYLVYKFTEKCTNLHGLVIIRNLLCPKSKEKGILYFRYPTQWNLHDTDCIPRDRKDGWMEVTVWKFNSSSELRNDCIPINLKLITYEGTMSGLIVCSLEVRPV